MQDFEKSIAYPVVKHNDLIQRARYNLSVNQQKLVAYTISLIKQTDKDLMMYEISVADFCELCGIDKNHFYTEFKDILLDLDKKSFLVETDEKIFNFRWYSEFEYLKGQGVVRLQLNSNLKRYLIGLSEKYTRYELFNILAIKGKYSIRIYELSKSFFYNKRQSRVEKEIDLTELKALLMAENYKEYRAFRRRVLEPSIKEINDYTDLNLSYEAVKEGKSVVRLKFHISRKKFPSNYASYIKVIDKLNERNGQIKGQMSIFDLHEEDFQGGLLNG